MQNENRTRRSSSDFVFQRGIEEKKYWKPKHKKPLWDICNSRCCFLNSLKVEYAICTNLSNKNTSYFRWKDCWVIKRKKIQYILWKNLIIQYMAQKIGPKKIPLWELYRCREKIEAKSLFALWRSKYSRTGHSKWARMSFDWNYMA